MLTVKEKERIIKKYSIREDDTGSPEVQIALLTKEIERLLAHLKKNHKDVHSKLGLIKMVSKRRTLLKGLKRKSQKRYASLIKRLGLRK